MLRIANVSAPCRLKQLCSLVSVRVNSTEAAVDHPKHWDTAKSFDAIPGPKPLPIVGNVLRFLPGIGEYGNISLDKLHKELSVKYGKIWRLSGIPGRKDMIMLYDPEDTALVYRNEGIWPVRDALPSFTYYRNVTRKEFFEGAGGALVAQGEAWGKFRSTVNQPMMQPRVSKFYVGPIDAVADDFIKRIPELRDENGIMPADFINEFYKWALESIVMVALDTRLGCLDGNLKPDSEAQKMINNVQIIFDSFFLLDVQFSLWQYISTPAWRRFVKSMDYFTEVCMKYINQSMERLKALPEGSDHELSVLERILARDPNVKTACVMALDMMMAGVDTTSHSVVFCLYYLAINPEVQTKLQAEIDRVIPRSNKGPITAENLNDMKYLKACIKESMRISPIALANIRTSVKDMVLQDYKIPKGTDVILGHMTMSNMEENFPQPDKFIPERWMKGDSTAGQLSDKKTHPFVFMPFGFGPRSCVGRRFAELEIEILVTKILRNYRVEWPNPPMVTETNVLHIAKSPLKFKLIDRK